MLMIRLQRIGRKNDPSYRIVVTDKRESTKSTRFADIVGTYQPKAGTYSIDGEKVKKWLQNGAKASPTVHNMLISKGIIEGKKINVLPKNKIIDANKAEAAKKAAEEAKNAPAPVVEVTTEEVVVPEAVAQTDEAPKNEEKVEEKAPAVA